MGIYEFDQELHDQVLLEDGEAIGLEKGKAIGREEGVDIGIHIYREILKGQTDNGILAASSGCSIEMVEKIRKQFDI